MRIAKAMRFDAVIEVEIPELVGADNTGLARRFERPDADGKRRPCVTTGP